LELITVNGEGQIGGDGLGLLSLDGAAEDDATRSTIRLRSFMVSLWWCWIGESHENKLVRGYSLTCRGGASSAGKPKLDRILIGYGGKACLHANKDHLSKHPFTRAVFGSNKSEMGGKM
jgi:hypothetical protein